MSEQDGDDRMWFVLGTGWNAERVAIENLRRQGIEAYCPMHLRTLRPRGQPERTVGMPFFPRYVFAHVDLSAPRWNGIYSTRGVAGVLPSGRACSKLLGKLVADLQGQEVKGYLTLAPEHMPCRWRPGDPVQYGAIKDAIFQERVDERRALILVSLLGRSDLHLVDLAQLD